MKRKPLYYGLVSQSHLVDTCCFVTNLIPGANAMATLSLLLETAAAETNLGELLDPTPEGAGAGLFQIDEETFDWIQTKNLKSRLAQLIEAATGIVIAKVQYIELRNNPLLCALFCRLRYAVITEAIPVTLEGRAAYWKKFYNSFDPNAKGTVEGYIKKAAAVAALDLGRTKLWDLS